MGNCEVCLDIGVAHAPMTTERLAEAVRDRDIPEVIRLLECGVDVNHPIDIRGHTVLDVLLSEHQELFGHFADAHGAGAVDGDDLHDMFEEQHTKTMNLFQLLRKHGASASADS
mmetsp:Transcript_65180/g.105398  ORF Transcript_65180/g.105398 Transcript_65180/m.105398 type:complete len:114 (+) Transcript_65180:70-411(+)